jgi:hypothetical protein
VRKKTEKNQETKPKTEVLSGICLLHSAVGEFHLAGSALFVQS